MLNINLNSVGYWRKADSPLAKMLMPLGFAFDKLGSLRKATNPYEPNTPLICVGNILMGGGGKTPLVIELVKSAIKMSPAKMELNPQVICHGYGSKTKHKVIKVAKSHTAYDVGDEALMIHQEINKGVWSGSPRAEVVKKADSIGASIGDSIKGSIKGSGLLVMDDGMFDPSVKKHFTILAMDDDYQFGNQRVFPAGPLRRSLAALKGRVDAVVVYQTGNRHINSGMAVPHYYVKKSLDPLTVKKLKKRDSIAFCGISQPEPFFEMVARLVPLKERLAFSSHHNPPARIMKRLVNSQMQLITTQKDFVRLPPPLQAKVIPLKLKLKWEDPTAPKRIIEAAINSGS